MKHIHYIGWIGYDNLGDDLMWNIFEKLAKKYLDPQKFKITGSFPKANINPEAPDIVVLGGGSLIIKKYINILYKYMEQNKKIIIWGSGYDWLEKEGMEKIKNNRKDLPVLLDSDSKQKLAEIVEYAEFVGVRGPLTYLALKNMNINMKKINISGDPGLLVKSSKVNRNNELSRWRNNDKIIGINWGTSNNKIYGQNELHIENQLSEAAKKFIKKGYKIFIYSVWKKDKLVNHRLYEKIGDPKNVILSSKLYNEHELMNLLQKCEFTINFKLHANVLSAMANVPFIALGYRFKTFDFAASIGLDELVISTDELNIEEEMMRLSSYICTHKEQIKNKINESIPLYEQRLLEPFHHQFYI